MPQVDSIAVTAPAAQAAPQTGLQLDGLQCVRSERLLFRDLSAHIPPGYLLRVEGANGSGKTSLLRLICGLLLPAAGRVLWHGRDVRRLREEFGRQLLYLGHAAALKGELSGLENLVLNATLGGFTPTQDTALYALQAAGLKGRERVPVRILSQGQRRRAALARLMLDHHAPLWVLDEPFNALDRTATAWLIALIAGHVKSGGIVVLTSHQSVALPQHLPQQVISL